MGRRADDATVLVAEGADPQTLEMLKKSEDAMTRRTAEAVSQELEGMLIARILPNTLVCSHLATCAAQG